MLSYGYFCLFFNVFRVRDYIAAGLDGKIVDPDGGIHEHRLRAQNADQFSVPSVLPANRWTSLLRGEPAHVPVNAFIEHEMKMAFV